MGLLRSVHDDTTPVHPKDDPEVRAKGREVEAARAALSEIEQRARTLEAERDAHHDELHMLLTAQEVAGLRARYIDARVALSPGAAELRCGLSESPRPVAAAGAGHLSRGGAHAG